MPGLPELPVPNTSREHAQVDGTIDTKAIYQTHRGKLPEGHDDKKPNTKVSTGLVEYEPEVA
jgi:hypothetical protein